MGDGKYRVRVQRHGKRRDLRANSLAEARTILAELNGAHAPIPTADLTMKVGTWLTRWLADAPLKATTRHTYHRLIVTHIRPYGPLWHAPLAEGKLTRRDLKAFMEHLATKPKANGPGTISAGTRVMVRNVLSSAMKAAIDAELRVTNPVTSLPIAIRRAQIQPPSSSEVGALITFLEARQDRRAPLYHVAVGTGLRQGELLGLRWQDVHLDAESPYLDVTGSLSWLDATRQDRTKTIAGLRRVPLPANVVMAFRVQAKRQAMERLAAGRRWTNHDGLVFTDASGEPTTGKAIRVQLRAALVSSGVRDARRARLGADVPAIRWHDFRHFYATLAIERGVRLETIQRIMGHASYTVTANIYGHLTVATADDVAAKIGDALAEVM